MPPKRINASKDSVAETRRQIFPWTVSLREELLSLRNFPTCYRVMNDPAGPSCHAKQISTVTKSMNVGFTPFGRDTIGRLVYGVSNLVHLGENRESIQKTLPSTDPMFGRFLLYSVGQHIAKTYLCRPTPYRRKL